MTELLAQLWRERMQRASLQSTPFLRPLGFDTTASDWWVGDVTCRRATKLLLAFEAWQLEHGALPEDLNDLVGPYFEQLPRDPYSGHTFLYLQQGVSYPLLLQQLIDLHGRSATRIAQGTPFLWSCGPQLVPMFMGPVANYRRINNLGAIQETTDLQEALPNGYSFLILRPGETPADVLDTQEVQDAASEALMPAPFLNDTTAPPNAPPTAPEGAFDAPVPYDDPFAETLPPL